MVGGYISFFNTKLNEKILQPCNINIQTLIAMMNALLSIIGTSSVIFNEFMVKMAPNVRRKQFTTRIHRVPGLHRIHI